MATRYDKLVTDALSGALRKSAAIAFWLWRLQGMHADHDPRPKHLRPISAARNSSPA